MVGYTEVLQAIMAMVIFSIILLTANRMMYRNTFVQVEGELEREVIALAQNIIEEARTLEFDENTTSSVPPPCNPVEGCFTESASLGSETGETSRGAFNDFDDFNNWEDNYSNRHGSFNLTSSVYYVTGDTQAQTTSRTTYKKIEVSVTNEFLTGSNTDVPKTYTFSYIRNYHAD